MNRHLRIILLCAFCVITLLQSFSASASNNLIGDRVYKIFDKDDINPVYNSIAVKDGGFLFFGGPNITKTNSQGKILWKLNLNVSKLTSDQKAAETKDGCYVLLCNMEGENTVFIEKIDTNGKMLWNKKFEGLIRVSEVLSTSDGGLVLWGSQTNENSGHRETHFKLIRIDENGKILWEKKLDDDFIPTSCSLIQTCDGGYAIVYSNISQHTSDKFICITGIRKLGADGNIQWNKEYIKDNNSSYYYQNILQTTDGGFLLNGVYMDKSNQEYSYLIRVDSNGQKVWSNTFKGFRSNKIINEENGFILLCNDCILKIDASGKKEWERYLPVGNSKYPNFAPEDYLHLNSIHKTKDNGYAISGIYLHPPGVDNNAYIIYLSSKITIKSNGSIYKLDVLPMVQNGTIMITADSLAKLLAVKYSYKNGEITFSNTKKQLKGQLYSNKSNSGAKSLNLDGIIYIAGSRENRIFVPVKAISEFFGFKYHFDIKTNTVSLTK